MTPPATPGGRAGARASPADILHGFIESGYQILAINTVNLRYNKKKIKRHARAMQLKRTQDRRPGGDSAAENGEGASASKAKERVNAAMRLMRIGRK